ncbi:MAG: rhomboid family intramembrane serine protease, partial [Candidatus Hadarchaeales archaeon]
MKCDVCGEENHSCKMISEAKPPRGDEGLRMEEPPQRPMVVKVSWRLPGGKRRHPLLQFCTFPIAAVILLFFIGQLIAEWVLGWDYYIPGRYETFLYQLAPSPATALARPWTLATSMFIHGSFLHMLVNLMVLISFGPALEMRIGKKRFLLLYFCSGVLAAFSQLLIIPPETVVLGASGAIL